MADNNNNKGGGGGQKAPSGLQMGVSIDPENMTPNKLAGVAGISGVMFLAAIGLNKLMPTIKRRLFGISDADAKKLSDEVPLDKAVSTVIKSLTGKDGAPPVPTGNIRYLAKCVGPALVVALKNSQQPEKDKADSLNALQKSLTDFNAGVDPSTETK